MLDAEPDVILKMPGDSQAPFWLTIALSALFVALLLHVWWLAGTAVAGTGLAILVWLWPEADLGQRLAAPTGAPAHG